MPQVSVIVPMFNASGTIVESLDSVFATEFAELEVVVVDDGSADQSIETVSQYIKTHASRTLKLVTHSGGKNLGAAASRNLGVQQASGEYVAFLDADDVYRPNRFGSTFRLLDQQPHLTAVFGTFLYELAGKGEQEQVRDISCELVTAVEHQVLIPPEDEDFLSQLLRGKSGLCTNTITIRRDAFIAAGGFPQIKYGEDLALWIRIFSTSEVARVDDQPLAIYRIHERSLCSQGELSPEFIFGPVYSLIHAAVWLRDRPDGNAAYELIRRRIPGKLFHQYEKVRNSTSTARKYMRQTMRSAVNVYPKLLMDRRFYSIFIRLLF